LAVTTNSTNLSCNPNSTSITGGSGTSTLSCAGSVPGNYLATVTGTSGPLSHSAIVTYHVQDFAISANPTRLVVNAGVAGASTITVAPVNGFSGTVTLAVTTNSTNLVCTLTATSITGGSGTSALSCRSSPAGNYLATVAGTSGTLSHSAIVVYHVQDFALSASPTSVTVNAGVTGTSTITVAPVNGFVGTVALAVTTNSTNLSCSLTSTSIADGSGTSTLSCTGSLAGNYLATATGTSGTLSYSAIVIYHVQDFKITGNPSSITSIVGSAPNSTITLSSLVGFSGNVNLAAIVQCTDPSGGGSGGGGRALEMAPMPSCPALSLSPPAIFLSAGASVFSILTVNGSSTPAGNYMVTVTGTSGNLVHSVLVNVTFTNSRVVPQAPSLTADSGSSSGSTMVIGGFTFEMIGLLLPLLALVVTAGFRNTRTRNISHDSFTGHQNSRDDYRLVFVPNVGYVQVWKPIRDS
jgi:hypothetical protein